jgi:hypothetical protein
MILTSVPFDNYSLITSDNFLVGLICLMCCFMLLAATLINASQIIECHNVLGRNTCMASRNECFLLFQILTPRHYQYHKFYNFGVNKGPQKCCFSKEVRGITFLIIHQFNENTWWPLLKTAKFWRRWFRLHINFHIMINPIASLSSKYFKVACCSISIFDLLWMYQQWLAIFFCIYFLKSK